ncbi:MAG: response regulator [Phycisphaerales bacterium]|nr:response regulator [Phycisphaerales bacterium]
MDKLVRPSQSESDAGRLRILVVEDHQNSAEVISLYLSMNGHVVRVACSAEKGYELACQSEFDLIISDVGLPDASGIELIRRIRRTRSTPAIAISGFRNDESVNTTAAGFEAHFVKPVDFEALCAEIARIVGRHRAR